MSGHGTQAADQRELAARSQELKALDASIEQARAQFEATRRRKLASTEALREADQRISSIGLRIRQTSAEVERLEGRIRKLDQEAAGIAQALRVHQARLQAELRAAYRVGGATPLRILLDSAGEAESARMLSYFRYFHRGRVEQIGLVQQRLAALRRVSSETLVAQEKLRSVAAEHRSMREQMRHERARRQAAVAKLEQELSDRSSRLERLRIDSERLEDLIAALEAALADADRRRGTKRFADRKGKLEWPLPGQLSARFGQPRGETGVNWRGLLITPSSSRDVRAVHAGTVVFAESLRGFGLTLIVDHGQDFLTIYARAEALYAKPGDTVAEGQVIGEIRPSSNRKRESLYFEIRHKGRPIDPSLWLAAK